jgi:hypothetical protein
MLTGGANPVVLDFGLAGSSEGLHGAVTQGLYGSVAYLAPEQARSHAVGTDPRTDVYQLGLVLYEMLTLRRAFPGNAIGDVLERIQHGRFPVPRKVHRLVPRELEAICLRAIELDPARRYQSARELREDLERWLGGHELPLALRAGRLRRTLRRARWHVRQRPWLSLAAGLVLAGGGGYLLWGGTLLEFEGRPLRYDSARDEPVYLAEGQKFVHVNDWIGFRFRTNKPVHVWTLSVFGPKEAPDRVSPWRARTTGAGLLRSDGPWGLEFPKGENVVLGPQVLDNHKEIEGLVLLVADGPRDFIERWFTGLKEQQGKDGLSWAEAQRFGLQAVQAGRGVGQDAPLLTRAEAERLSAAFARAEAAAGGAWIDEIPGVRMFQVQCLTR